jgi:hypothetical protein
MHPVGPALLAALMVDPSRAEAAVQGMSGAPWR